MSCQDDDEPRPRHIPTDAELYADLGSILRTLQHFHRLGDQEAVGRYIDRALAAYSDHEFAAMVRQVTTDESTKWKKRKRFSKLASKPRKDHDAIRAAYSAQVRDHGKYNAVSTVAKKLKVSRDLVYKAIQSLKD